MKSLHFKPLVILIVVLFLMSKSKHILQWFYSLHDREILTLEPMRYYPDDARAAITVAAYILFAVIIWKLIHKKW